MYGRLQTMYGMAPRQNTKVGDAREDSEENANKILSTLFKYKQYKSTRCAYFTNTIHQDKIMKILNLTPNLPASDEPSTRFAPWTVTCPPEHNMVCVLL